MMKQMAGSLPGARRAAKKGKKGGKNRKGGRSPVPRSGMPQLPGGLPALPPGLTLPPGLNPDLSNLKLPES